MLADYFERSGIESYYLGRNIPLRSLIDNLISTEASLLTISVTMEENLNALEKLIHDLRQHPKLGDLKVLVGGQAFENKENLWKQVGADGYASNFIEAVSVAQDLLNDQIKEPEYE